MSLAVADGACVCSAGALLSGAVAASSLASVGVALETSAVAAGSEVGAAWIGCAIAPVLVAATVEISVEISASEAAGAATVSATGSAAVSATALESSFDSESPAATTWFASAVAVASWAIAPAETADDNPIIAGDASSKFQIILFIFLTQSHSI